MSYQLRVLQWDYYFIIYRSDTIRIMVAKIWAGLIILRTLFLIFDSNLGYKYNL
jgi:hypothetical protein